MYSLSSTSGRDVPLEPVELLDVASSVGVATDGSRAIRLTNRLLPAPPLDAQQFERVTVARHFATKRVRRPRPSSSPRMHASFYEVVVSCVRVCSYRRGRVTAAATSPDGGPVCLSWHRGCNGRRDDVKKKEGGEMNRLENGWLALDGRARGGLTSKVLEKMERKIKFITLVMIDEKKNPSNLSTRAREGGVPATLSGGGRWLSR